MKGCMLQKKEYVCLDWLEAFQKYSFVKVVNSASLVMGVGFFLSFLPK